MMVGSVRARDQVTAASSGIAAPTSTADNALWPGENRAEVPHLAWMGFVVLNLLALYHLILSVVIGIIEGSPAQWGMNYLAPEQGQIYGEGRRRRFAAAPGIDPPSWGASRLWAACQSRPGLNNTNRDPSAAVACSAMSLQ